MSEFVKNVLATGLFAIVVVVAIAYPSKQTIKRHPLNIRNQQIDRKYESKMREHFKKINK